MASHTHTYVYIQAGSYYNKFSLLCVFTKQQLPGKFLLSWTLKCKIWALGWKVEASISSPAQDLQLEWETAKPSSIISALHVFYKPGRGPRRIDSWFLETGLDFLLGTVSIRNPFLMKSKQRVTTFPHTFLTYLHVDVFCGDSCFFVFFPWQVLHSEGVHRKASSGVLGLE